LAEVAEETLIPVAVAVVVQEMDHLAVLAAVVVTHQELLSLKEHLVLEHPVKEVTVVPLLQVVKHLVVAEKIALDLVKQVVLQQVAIHLGQV
jgi:uncharacterized protein (DUF983 family)